MNVSMQNQNSVSNLSPEKNPTPKTCKVYVTKIKIEKLTLIMIKM